MLKKILSEQYIIIVRMVEIALVLLALPFLYNLIPIDKRASDTLYIDAGNKESVFNSLEENGYTVTLIDKMMMQVDQLPQSGWYTLKKKEHGRFSFFRNIYKHKAKTMHITVFAGETHDELLNRLAHDTKRNREKLYQAYKKFSRFKEADIFAGQYVIARSAKEESLMRYLFNESHKILEIFVEKNFRHKPDHNTVKVLLTIASIIQKESNAIDEMPIISSVIYNRLNKNMKLQMDSTLNYGIYSHKIVTPERIKSDSTFYNTYKYKGLPPYPLGTITINALHAAMFPSKSRHLFFMLKPDGTHVFCENYTKHLENIRSFRAYQKKREKEKKRLACVKKTEEKVLDNNESNTTH